jgi:hypothetical protein
MIFAQSLCGAAQSFTKNVWEFPRRRAGKLPLFFSFYVRFRIPLCIFAHENQFPREVWRSKPESTQAVQLSVAVWRVEAGKYTAVQLSVAVWRDEAGKHTAVQLSVAVWRDEAGKHTSGTTFSGGLEVEAGKHTAVQLSGRSGGSKPESAQRYSFRGGMEGRSPSICAAGATPLHKPSKFPAHSAPERAVVVLCANKIDFRDFHIRAAALSLRC